MKQKIFLFAFLLLILASCGASQEEKDAAKQELLGLSGSNISENEASSGQTLEEDILPSQETLSPITLTQISGPNLLDFSLPSGALASPDELEITGTTLWNVEKIVVDFSNPTSDYPNDSYTLKQFSSGDTSFRYIASSKNKVLDYGENHYVFSAYSQGQIAKYEIILRVSEDQKGETSQVVDMESLNLNLPTSTSYGEPIQTGDSTLTYSQIKWLEIQSRTLTPVTCDSEAITNYLTDLLSTWFYWNTCRDIVEGKGVSVYVLRLDGDMYVYEKQYIDFTHGLLASYELERGTGVNKDTLQEKNSLLKEESFPAVEVVDSLMRDIVRM